jgi:hypothetical protein
MAGVAPLPRDSSGGRRRYHQRGGESKRLESLNVAPERNWHPLTTALGLLKIEALNPSQAPQGGRAVKARAGIQVLVVLAIFALAGLIPLLGFGVRAALGRWWVEPACQEQCRASGSVFTQVVYDTPKRGGDQSACVCSSGARIPSAQANTASHLSLLSPFFVLVIMPALGIYWWSCRSRSRR